MELERGVGCQSEPAEGVAERRGWANDGYLGAGCEEAGRKASKWRGVSNTPQNSHKKVRLS